MTQGGFDIGYIADLARIDLTGTEREVYAAQLESILHYVEKLKEPDVEDIEPTAHPVGHGNVIRPDAVRPSLPAAEVLKRAPREVQGLIATPRIVE